jgi:tellurite resistance protein
VSVSAVPVAAGATGRRRPRIAPNLFSVSFGLTGLADAWRAAGPVLGIPSAVPDALFILAAAVWFILVVAYAAQGPVQLLADLRDPVLAPFVSVPAIVAMTLGAALAGVAFAVGRVLVVIFLTLTLALGGWLMGQWVLLDIAPDRMHPGYFLPTVAGGFIGAIAATDVHLHGAAEVSFGVSVISWLLLGSTVLNRLFFRPALPAALLPTLAIEVAPPAGVGVAYFALSNGAINAIAYGLGGYAILMAVMQLRLAPLYLRQRFSVTTWAFTFSYAIAAVFALEWITLSKVAGGTGYAATVLALITILVGGIGVRSIVAMVRGQPTPAG